MELKRIQLVADDDANADLPPAVRARIITLQDSSERLIGWIQLAIIIMFGVLYGLSRQTAPMTTAIWLITPAAIGLYFIATVIRLVLSYRIRMGFWLLAGSILIDMALLYSLIWSFHLQYMQPASFYLKAPTQQYVYIFIALRALRFEVRYVVLAGAAAALGWLTMVGYVVFADPHDAMITRNYVQYLTSNSVLLGAEFDKIITIAAVTTILAFAIHGARRMMTQAVTGAQAQENLSRFFAPEIARQISRSGDAIRAGDGEARDAAILNLDVRGFTKLASMASPQEVMSVLADYQRRMVPIIQRHGGAIDKFLGDGIMATFGATRPVEDYAARAMRALEECMAAAAEWSAEQAAAGRPPLIINGALASGRIVAGAVGDATRLEYTVIGDAVNLSAKLEKHNKTEGCRALALKETHDAALAQGYKPQGLYRVLSGAMVGGVAVPLDLVAIA
ncbi:adenylate/guanylate cyclase domain-containing protein [Dongia deserti]|uniref:adenylate/guanylate cyclase domain-containing protein n=1 Tax=Dongia deserti TaxID=2268030 RepID=UPI000E647096|nr:adenylate/guanylate cyclase domain-containing protein [Dongia deserti]